jgi:DNA processing protein
VVASGLALGIDAEAHLAALAADGKTLAVLGAGLAKPYPRRHAGLFRRIAREGLLISEFLPHEHALKHHFPRRNRTLAALAQVVVVVEAAERSGALNTASHATDLGRDLLAVPGPIYAPMSRGTNELLRRALPLLSPATVLEHLSGGSGQALSLFPLDPPADVGPDALRVWNALAEAPRHVDELARAAELAPSRALAALSRLEVGGWIRQEPGARFARGSV